MAGSVDEAGGEGVRVIVKVGLGTVCVEVADVADSMDAEETAVSLTEAPVVELGLVEAGAAASAAVVVTPPTDELADVDSAPGAALGVVDPAGDVVAGFSAADDADGTPVETVDAEAAGDAAAVSRVSPVH